MNAAEYARRMREGTSPVDFSLPENKMPRRAAMESKCTECIYDCLGSRRKAIDECPSRHCPLWGQSKIRRQRAGIDDAPVGKLNILKIAHKTRLNHSHPRGNHRIDYSLPENRIAPKLAIEACCTESCYDPEEPGTRKEQIERCESIICPLWAQSKARVKRGTKWTLETYMAALKESYQRKNQEAK
ncbi:MAG: hypothetical protein GY832_30925 [Chloroflexi bacterium]|nr:hypothetical protein [Chloroflexota bacterium]